MLIESSIVTARPTDVNWAVLQYPDVSSAGSGRSYTPAREFRDAMSALLYNFDNVIPLRREGPGTQGQPRNPEAEATREKKGAHGGVEVLIREANKETEVEGSRGGRQYASLDGGPNQLCDSFVPCFSPYGPSASRDQLRMDRGSELG